MEANLIRRKEAIVERLRKGHVVIDFVKADGSNSQITGTLLESQIPESKRPVLSEGKKVEYSDNQIRFWSVDREGWRSVSVDRVNDYKAI